MLIVSEKAENLTQPVRLEALLGGPGLAVSRLLSALSGTNSTQVGGKVERHGTRA